jgi:HSP20 family protein
MRDRSNRQFRNEYLPSLLADLGVIDEDEDFVPGFDFGVEFVPRDDVIQESVAEESRKSNQPPVNMTRTNNEYLVEIELPGATKEEINVKVDEKARVIVNAPRKSQKPADSDGFLMHEFNSSAGYSRTLKVPTDGMVKDMKANYENGVLVLRIPRQQAQQDKDKSTSISIQ